MNANDGGKVAEWRFGYACIAGRNSGRAFDRDTGYYASIMRGRMVERVGSMGPVGAPIVTVRDATLGCVQKCLMQ